MESCNPLQSLFNVDSQSGPVYNGHLMSSPSSLESKLFRLLNDRKEQSVSDESISLCSNVSEKHADNIFFPNVNFLKFLKFSPFCLWGARKRTDHFSLVFGGSIYIWVRNKMTTERLSDLAVIAMHANTVTIDSRLIYEKCVALLPRRMMPSSLFAD